MEIKRAGSQPSRKGPSEWFTGTVRIDPLFQAPDPARVAGASRLTDYYTGGAVPEHLERRDRPLRA